MEIIKVFYNHGRWCAECPACTTANKVSIGDEMLVCGHCYHDKIATKFSMLPDGTVIMGYDKEKQDSAKSIAYANDEVYELEFPSQAKQIEEILRLRRTEDQQWLPGETTEDLLKENNEHPQLTYIKKVVEKITLPGEKKEEVENLDQKLLRRIV